MEKMYETVCIIRADAGEDVIKGIITKATATVEANGGHVVKLDEWGRRRLAYPIAKKHEGYYFVLNYKSRSEQSKELGRILRLNEDVLRYQTIAGVVGAEEAPKAEDSATKNEATKGDQNG
ncbi:MAG: 30S ribosomal protein S6 [Deltaproteobacteria bacterium]